MALSKKKIAAAATAVALSASLLLGGTYAWQSTNQVALNEASDIVNPGGRLHDDFNGTNKDVYVENFATEPIYARIQLSEYMEIVMNYGTDFVNSHTLAGEKTTDENGEVGYKYDIHYFGESNATDEYWTWTTGGSTIYMPTFNLNKDSLVADTNGTYLGAVGGIIDQDETQYEGYVTYTDGESKTENEIYDADSNDVDELGSDFENIQDYVDSGNVVTVEGEHTATSTLDGSLISMDEWIAGGSMSGPYWVYDTDGWVYWAQAIEPGTATGLLLDGIELTQVMDDTWYYAINVTAQFVTADDVGKSDGTGFYDTSKGTVPTTAAEDLLAAIGVQGLEDSSTSGGAGDQTGLPKFTEDSDIVLTFENYDIVDTKHEELSSNEWRYLYFQATINQSLDAEAVSYGIYDSSNQKLDSALVSNEQTNPGEEKTIAAVLTDVPSETQVGESFTAVVTYVGTDGQTYGKSATVSWNGGYTSTGGDTGVEVDTAGWRFLAQDGSEVEATYAVGLGDTLDLKLVDKEGNELAVASWAVSSDSSSIDENGLLTVGANETQQDLTITATADGGGEYSNYVRVLGSTIPISYVSGGSIASDDTSKYLASGESMILSVGEGYDNSNVEWTVFDAGDLESCVKVEQLSDGENNQVMITHLCETCDCNTHIYFHVTYVENANISSSVSVKFTDNYAPYGTISRTGTDSAVTVTVESYTTGIDLVNEYGLTATIRDADGNDVEYDLSKANINVYMKTDDTTKVENGILFLGENETSTDINLGVEFVTEQGESAEGYYSIRLDYSGVSE